MNFNLSFHENRLLSSETKYIIINNSFYLFSTDFIPGAVLNAFHTFLPKSHEQGIVINQPPPLRDEETEVQRSEAKRYKASKTRSCTRREASMEILLCLGYWLAGLILEAIPPRLSGSALVEEWGLQADAMFLLLPDPWGGLWLPTCKATCSVFFPAPRKTPDPGCSDFFLSPSIPRVAGPPPPSHPTCSSEQWPGPQTRASFFQWFPLIS